LESGKGVNRLGFVKARGLKEQKIPCEINKDFQKTKGEPK